MFSKKESQIHESFYICVLVHLWKDIADRSWGKGDFPSDNFSICYVILRVNLETQGAPTCLCKLPDRGTRHYTEVAQPLCESSFIV